MSKILFRSLTTLSLAALLALGVSAQDTKKEVIVNPDGSYTVIEYPIGKEVVVNLTPSTAIRTAKGIARVMRSDDGTTVTFDISELPGTAVSYHAYAVDPAGATTYLGPITVTDGIAKAAFTTPMSQFMLMVSPTEGLTAMSPTNTVFTSTVPSGYAVVPKGVSEKRTVQVAGDVRSRYDVPMLRISTFPDTEKEIKVKFSGELAGLEGKAYVDREDGTTKVKMHFDDMDKVPANKRLTLWTVSPDGKYTKLGSIINSGQREEAQIRSETSLTDFGLFVTAEDTDVDSPTSSVYTVLTANIN